MGKKTKIRATVVTKKETVENTEKQYQPIGKPVEETSSFAFARENYKLLLIGLALIVVGFLLMIGGGSQNPDIFSEGIFSFQRLTLAPILVLAGYVIELFAIMKNRRPDK